MRGWSPGIRPVVRAAILAVLGALTVAIPPVHAQLPSAPQKLSVAPAIVQDTVNPGISYTIQITVGNGTNDPTAFHSVVEPLRVNDAVSDEMLERLGNTDWFKITPADFLLLGQQTRTVDVTITIPNDAEPGGHYSTVFFEAFVPGQANSNLSTVVTGRVGVVALLTVTGDVREGVLVTKKLHADKGFSTNYETPLSFSSKNTGNVHVEPSGTILIDNIFGKEVKQIPMSGGSAPGSGPLLLPGAEHRYQVTWDHGMRFGYYKAHASIVVGSSKMQTNIGSTSFFVCPTFFFWLIIFLGVVIVGVALVALIRRQKRKRQLDSSTQPSKSG